MLNDVYTYDPNANVVGIVDEQQALTTRSLGYDGLDRLITASGVWGSGAFSYDPLDNLRTSTIGARNYTHEIDPITNRLDFLNEGASTVMAYEYDDRGNMTQRGTQGFQFDLANRIHTATDTASYRYDGLGRRTLISENSGAERVQVYSQAGQLLHEVDTQTDAVTNYVYLGSTLLARSKIASGSPAPLAPPLTLTPTNPAQGDYKLTWVTSQGADRYILEEQVNAGDWLIVSDGPERLKLLEGKPSGVYVYRVKACAALNCGAFGPTATITITIGSLLIPGQPTPSVNPSTDGSYTLTWSLSQDPRVWTFDLEEHNGSGNWSNVGTLIPGKTWQVNGQANGTYSYRVKACLENLTCGGWSPIGQVTVARASVPPKPVLAASPNPSFDGAFTVNWTPLSTALHTLQRRNGSQWNTVYSGNPPSKWFDNEANGSHTFRVQSCIGASSCSAWSNSLSVTVAIPEIPATPHIPQPNLVTSVTGNYSVTWNGVTDATRYELYETASGTPTPVLVHNAAATTKSFSGRVNRNYGYKVRACNATGCSADSVNHVVQVRIPLPLVTGVTGGPVSNTDGNYTISWNAVPEATSYTLIEVNGPGGASTSIQVQAPALSKSFVNRETGSYLYAVKACDMWGACSTSFSPSQYFTIHVARPDALSIPTGLIGPTNRVDVPPNFQIAWNPVTGATSYVVEESRACAPPGNRVEEVVNTNQFTGPQIPCFVAGNSSYVYRVKACDGNACSGWTLPLHVDVRIVGGAQRPDAPTLVETRTYLHTDALGSPVAETNASGIVTQRMRYEPYGAPTNDTYTDGPAFTGHVQDAVTGLTYMQQRYHDPLAGRFLSVDPVAADPNTGGNFNRYWYGNNNPYKYVDPDGRFAWFVPIAIYAIGALTHSAPANAPAPGQEGISDSPGDILASGLPPVKAVAAVKVAVRGAKETSRAARREAQREAGVPTSRSADSQSGREGQRQIVVEGADGKPKAVTQHPSDKDHSKPHWHAADAKTDPVSGDVRTNKYGQVKYESGSPAVEYEKKK